MRTTLVPALLLAVAATRVAAAPPAETERAASIRPLTREATLLIDEGVRRSPFMASLVARLDASDLVVFINEVFDSGPGEPKGALQFVSSAAGRRYVLVRLSRWKLSWSDRLVLLGHELQHAVEVAGAADVVDLASFSAFYLRIGWQVRDGRFETAAACQATARVRLDLDLSRSMPAVAVPTLLRAGDENGRDSRRIRRDP
jgi:hypothetical protein